MPPRRSSRQSIRIPKREQESDVVDVAQDTAAVDYDRVVSETPSPSRPRFLGMTRTSISSATTPATGRSSKASSSANSGSITPATSVPDDEEDDDLDLLPPKRTKSRSATTKAESVSTFASCRICSLGSVTDGQCLSLIVGSGVRDRSRYPALTSLIKAHFAGGRSCQG